MPALRKFIAMPPPIVPAPITRTFSILRSGVSSGTSGIFAAARSAKKAWRSARDSGVCISWVKVSRSKRMPSSNFIVVEARDGVDAFAAAPGSSSLIAPTVLRANCRKAWGFGCCTLRSRTFGSGRASAFSRA